MREAISGDVGCRATKVCKCVCSRTGSNRVGCSRSLNGGVEAQTGSGLHKVQINEKMSNNRPEADSWGGRSKVPNGRGGRRKKAGKGCVSLKVRGSSDLSLHSPL